MNEAASLPPTAPRVPTDAPAAARKSFHRNQRRRHSAAAAVTAGGAALKPEMFERLWSAHASTTSWQRSYVATNTDAVLTPADRQALRTAFVEDAERHAAQLVAKLDTASATASAASPDPRATHQREPVAHPHDAVSPTPQPVATSKADGATAAAPLSSIYVTVDGARRVRDLIARALRLTWLASLDDVLGFAKSVVLHDTQQTQRNDKEHTSPDESAPSPQELDSTTVATAAVDWSSIRLTEEHILSIASAVKDEAATRRCVTLAAPLGHAAGGQEDPYAAPDEITAAFASLGGRTDLSGKAHWSETSRLLTAACVDESALLDLTTKRGTRHRSEGSAGGSASASGPSATIGDGAASSSGSIPSARRPRAGSDATELSDRSAVSRHSFAAGGGGGVDGTSGLLPPFQDDDEDPGLPFRDFQALLSVDPWKATAARIFATLGGVAYDPNSTVPFSRVATAYERMLRIELPEDTAAAFVERLAQTVDVTRGLTFDTFENTVIVTLRRVCAGGMGSDGGAGGGGGGQANAAAGSAGSAGLLRMLTYQPAFGPKTMTTKQVLSRVDALMANAKRHRDEYRRIRGKTSVLFQQACMLQGTPLSHLAKLTRRRLLYFVNMIGQRRTFNLSPPNATIERFLRCLTAAAHVLRDHGLQCKHCQAFALAIKPSHEKRQRSAGKGINGANDVAPSPSDLSDLANYPPPPKALHATPLRTMSPALKPPQQGNHSPIALTVTAGASQPSLTAEPSGAAAAPLAPAPPPAGTKPALSARSGNLDLHSTTAVKVKPWSNGGIATARRYVPPAPRVMLTDQAPQPPPRTARPTSKQQQPTSVGVLSHGSSRRTEDNFVRALFKRRQLQQQEDAKAADPHHPSWTL